MRRVWNSLSSFDDDFNLFDNEKFIFKKDNSEYQVLDKNRIHVSFNAPDSKLSVEGFGKILIYCKRGSNWFLEDLIILIEKDLLILVMMRTSKLI